MTRRSDGLYQQSVLIGRKRVYFYGKTKSEVFQKIQKYKDAELLKTGFTQVAEEWWRDKEPRISASTRNCYLRPMLRAEQYFGDKPVAEIRTYDISVFMDRMIHDHNMARKTASVQMIPIREIFSYAAMKGYTDSNTALSYKLPANLKKTKRRAPSSEDIAIVKSGDDSQMALFLMMALYTGLRKGELLALTWEDIDIEARTISVTKSVTYVGNRPEIKPPKTEAGVRVVGIPDKLAEVLHPATGLVFHTEDGQLFHCSRFTRMWTKYKEKTGLKSTPHNMRHGYATMLMENNIPIKDAQALLGHAQASTTIDTYADIRAERAKERIKQTLGIDID